MPDSNLMFNSATELAGMVRAGEISARELVRTSTLSHSLRAISRPHPPKSGSFGSP